jgi:S-adenosylmethionine synthetase
MSRKILTAESVCEGHPDKLCDLIADSILDECLRNDPYSRVACEVLATHGKICIAGELTTSAQVDYMKVVKNTLSEVGYEPSEYKIEIDIHKQSPDIDGGVTKKDGTLGAGDQGVVYGFACNETGNLLPLPVVLANSITRTIDKMRHDGELDGIKPDGKCLVSVEYEDDVPTRISDIVVSVQHDEKLSLEEVTARISSVVLPKVFKRYPIDAKTKILINPSGRFVVGGPEADTGLTGRKLMCDTYGGLAHHGGGAFSGKDATKVDRSAAYFARYVAKHLVATELAKKCEVCVTYAIGQAEPVAIEIDTFGPVAFTSEELLCAVKDTFDFTPHGIINQLKLREPIYTQTTRYGHFTNQDLPYEQLDKVNDLLGHVIFGKEYKK